jgi:hypothetical protein
MIIALWITAILLSLLYLLVGGMKLARSKEQLSERMSWVTRASTWQVKLVGALEVLGALGVILPLATGIAPVLTAVAAIGLVLVQVVAISLHLRWKDAVSHLTINAVLLLLAVAVAVLRFVSL